jgi:Immunoglobulin-like domain of bacterial spore germination
MNRTYILIAILMIGCNSRPSETRVEEKADTMVVEEEISTPPTDVTVYGNARFKNVTVEKTGDHTFLVTGKGLVFEATISWVVEDGHDELLTGFVTADAGAPEWGNFSFTIDITKKRENSTLTLILFESSAQDGSRQHELPMMLY